MGDQTTIFALGKVLIAAAWADGELANEEVNSLKDLLFLLPTMSALEWSQLDMYIEEPIGEEERARLIEDLRGAVRSVSEKKMALDALDELIAADGEITAEEEQVAVQIREAINGDSGGMLSGISKLMKGSVKRRSAATSGGPNREDHFEDFIDNKVFYSVRRHLEAGASEVTSDEEKLRKLSLAGGLMARIAHADGEIDQSEVAKIEAALANEWGISHDEARFVAEVALTEASRDLDFHRLTRSFFRFVPDDVDRLRFVDLLLHVAISDGMATAEELREIRHIATGLKLTRAQFNERKTQIPRQRREG